MPVRNFAAVALERWLNKSVAVEILRPHIKNLLVIYIKIIEECDHETIIGSLNGIFTTFQKEIQPFLSELLQKLVQLIVRIHEKSSSEEQYEEAQFSMLTTFETIKQLLKCKIEQSQIAPLFNIIKPLITRTINEEDIQFFEETLLIINVFLFNCQQGHILP